MKRVGGVGPWVKETSRTRVGVYTVISTGNTYHNTVHAYVYLAGAGTNVKKPLKFRVRKIPYPGTIKDFSRTTGFCEPC